MRLWLRAVLKGVVMPVALCSGIGYGQKVLQKKDEAQDWRGIRQDWQDVKTTDKLSELTIHNNG